LLEAYEGREHKSAALRDRIVPDLHEIEFWDAFRFLSKFRRYDDGNPLPFSLSDLSSYCDLAGIDDAARRLEMTEMILALDFEWFDIKRDEAELKAKNERNRIEREKARK
jgi:hypothetical protein